MCFTLQVRSQATVLKKAVLDEQTKNSDLNEHIKNLEQTVRIRDQEMESLLFRNDQLTKRIAFLQQELQTSSNVKKGKLKSSDISSNNDVGVFNEELQKKITENAELLSTVCMANVFNKLDDCFILDSRKGHRNCTN